LNKENALPCLADLERKFPDKVGFVMPTHHACNQEQEKAGICEQVPLITLLSLLKRNIGQSKYYIAM
jgi:hypothetical protein